MCVQFTAKFTAKQYSINSVSNTYLQLSCCYDFHKLILFKTTYCNDAIIHKSFLNVLFNSMLFWQDYFELC